MGFNSGFKGLNCDLHNIIAYVNLIIFGSAFRGKLHGKMLSEVLE